MSRIDATVAGVNFVDGAAAARARKVAYGLAPTFGYEFVFATAIPPLDFSGTLPTGPDVIAEPIRWSA
jgi:hypothetical protein